MTVLNLDECRRVNTTVDYILDHPAKNVRSIKDTFGLNSKEYDMISELMMPAMRRREGTRKAEQENTKLRAKIKSLEDKIAKLEHELARYKIAALDEVV